MSLVLDLCAAEVMIEQDSFCFCVKMTDAAFVPFRKVTYPAFDKICNLHLFSQLVGS